MLLNIADHLAHQKLTLTAAARKTGMSEDRLRAVAEGAEPSLRELRQISGALKLPLSALISQHQPNAVQMLFRKNVGRRPTSEILVEDVLSSQLNGIHHIASALPSNLSWLDVFHDLEVSPTNAWKFAEKFRDHFFSDEQLEPILELPQLIANKIGVFVILIDNQETEGVSAIIGQHAFILLSRRSFKPRMLFTLAHEIGHLVGHRSKDGAEEFALFDKENAVGVFQRPRGEDEQFADAFASALLMPQRTVFMMIDSVRKRYNLSGPLGDIEINFLARFFGVSFEVAGRRCEDLELLPVGGAHTLYNELVKRHLNPEQRASDAGLPPRETISFDISSALLYAGVRKINSGDISIGKAAEVLHVPLSALVAVNSEGGE